MKILIADTFPEAQQKSLTDAGHAITYSPNLQGDELQAALSDNEILIVRSTKIEAAMLDAATALCLIIRAGAGTNTIACDAATEKDIKVCNVPGANSVAVAELVMGLLICIDRRLADNVADLRNFQWRKKKYSQASGLLGKTIGILGLGAIGVAVAERARAFGMRVISVANPKRAATQIEKIKSLGIKELGSRDELLAASDIVTLHLPANADTEKMVNAEFLAKMQARAILINTSRGNLVDEDALLKAMDEKGIRAGLDVYQNEPASGEAEFKSAVAVHPNVVGSHHIGASTAQAQLAVAEGVLRVIKSYEDGELLNRVN